MNFRTRSLLVSTSLTAYLQTRKALWYWMTVALGAIATTVVFFVPEDLYPWSLSRNVVGIVFVMGLPGWAFVKLVFPGGLQTENPMKPTALIEQLSLSVGFSTILVPIVGLGLNYTPWGIRLAPAVISLFLLMLIFSSLAVIREYRTGKRKLANSPSNVSVTN